MEDTETVIVMEGMEADHAMTNREKERTTMAAATAIKKILASCEDTKQAHHLLVVGFSSISLSSLHQQG